MSRFFTFCLLFISGCLADEGFQGLNGFVKESSELGKFKKNGGEGVDLSQAKVELYTPAGIRKYETECTPNGYYFIAVYDTGSFVAKVKGPGGWSVTPAKVAVECTAAGCADGEDVNFDINGFSVKGKIEGAAVEGCTDTLSKLNSVTVTLKSAGGKGSPATVKAAADGTYVFNKVVPGDYVITATHPTWTLGGSKKGIPVSVKWEGVHVQEAFTIKGYQLSGKVEWKNQPVADVEVTLFSDSPVKIDCSKPPQSSADSKKLGHPACLSKTNSQGEFAFGAVPCGKYTLVPRYSTPSTEFQVSPPSLPVSVGHGNAQLGPAFKVTGFSIGGRVVHPATGAGVEGATIKLNGKTVGSSNAQGVYSLGQMEDGVYSIEASKNHHKFQRLDNIEVIPSMGQLPDIMVLQYAVCGSLSLDSSQFSMQQSVGLTSEKDGARLSVTADASGKFCFWAGPGKHTMQVQISEKDRGKGLVLGPRKREILVKNVPVFDAIFVEKRVSLKVVVRKLDAEGDWGKVGVKLSGQDFAPMEAVFGKTNGDVELVVRNDKELVAVFKELVPSAYTLKISRKGWCWNEESVSVSLDDQDKEAKPFVQKGYLSQVYLSHAATLKISGPGAEDSMSKEYAGGVSHSICLKDIGDHSIEPSGCLTFEKGIYSFDPSKPGVLKITATHFHTTGSIRVNAPKLPETPVSVKIECPKSGTSKKVRAVESGKGTLSFPVEGALKDVLKVTPMHSTLLFYPPSMELVNSGKGCQPEMKSFAAKRGLFVKASTEPPVAGVQVVLTGAGGKVFGKSETDASGSVSFGPLHDNQKYSVQKMEKTGYEFENKGSSEDLTSFVFRAKQLAKVEVQINIPGEDKQGVLVVLTGGDRYRSNGKTDKNGVVSFWNLPPSAYYIKPVLKEYEFTPGVKDVTVEDGKDELVSFEAERTAFSVSGSIKGFTDKVLGGVTIEAVGPDDLYESTVSADDGFYRIRGLKSDVQYNVRVVSVDGVERGWPESRSVTLQKKPESGLDFTVFLTPEVRRVTGVIDMDPDLCNRTSVEILQIPKDGGKPKLVEEATLDITRWFDFGVYPGKYLIRSVSNSLQSKYECKHAEKTLIVGKEGPGEIHAGEISMECAERHHVGESGNGNRWPVVLAIVAVVVMQWRKKIQGVLMGA
ncbi:hypothetical protein BSKO_05379 [Bryopsis sp. KO-2023]|nr:hypothetical protein BSKO_05379 [Bryopsis sp. KO-2023]